MAVSHPDTEVWDFSRAVTEREFALYIANAALVAVPQKFPKVRFHLSV